MIDLNNIDFSKISICEAVIKITAQIRDDVSEKEMMDICQNKSREALLEIPEKLEEVQKLKRLLALFYKKWRFSDSCQAYKLSEMLWLNKVFLSNYGNSYSLGILFLYIAHLLKVSVVPIIFPTQLILTFIDSEKKKFYINPINGDIVNEHILETWLKGNISPAAVLHINYLQESQPLAIIKKILEMLKIALIEEKDIELALSVSNILLTLKPKDPYEIRDRGLIFSQLSCYHVAMSDLLYFIEQCPDDPVSDIIKIQMHAIEQKKIVFH
ncbi:tetratricopeptide repeat protein [Buchnera aphidicola]|uniref:transglutaminase family protein n=1 Tax=Buchnera aphidicola TaxID=9 RepID=UPI00094D5A0D|nr:tetratricopeptide repeat protein [Buchnera aphidicola]